MNSAAGGASRYAIWKQTLRGEVSRITTIHNSQGVIYGGGVFSYNIILPPTDARASRQSLFAWHFEALRRAI